jgi:3-oxoacyl-[acyl-carrier protein] reductase
MSPLPLAGRSALVTGVGRRRGIGYAVAGRLVDAGASVVLHHHADHDREVYGEPDDVDAMVTALSERAGPGAVVHALPADLADAESPHLLVAEAVSRVGHLDVLVANHASSRHEVSLVDLTAEALDHHWQVETRATLLLTQAFAAQHDGREGGRVVWLTSGQDLGPMRGNLAYAVAKGALASATRTVADELVEQGILLNTVNPGPVNTGYLDDAPADFAARFPLGRVGEPDDPARLIAWLVSDAGRWMVGQVLNSEGGFRR